MWRGKGEHSIYIVQWVYKVVRSVLIMTRVLTGVCCENVKESLYHRRKAHLKTKTSVLLAIACSSHRSKNVNCHAMSCPSTFLREYKRQITSAQSEDLKLAYEHNATSFYCAGTAHFVRSRECKSS